MFPRFSAHNTNACTNDQTAVKYTASVAIHKHSVCSCSRSHSFTNGTHATDQSVASLHGGREWCCIEMINQINIITWGTIQLRHLQHNSSMWMRIVYILVSILTVGFDPSTFCQRTKPGCHKSEVGTTLRHLQHNSSMWIRIVYILVTILTWGLTHQPSAKEWSQGARKTRLALRVQGSSDSELEQRWQNCSTLPEAELMLYSYFPFIYRMCQEMLNVS